MINKKNLSILLPISILTLTIIGQFGALPGSVAPAPAATTQSPMGTPYPIQYSLHASGATFPANLITYVASQYHTANPSTTIYYNGIGSGGGQLNAADKNGDFFASDAPLSVAQQPMYANILTIPETIGSVTFSYNVNGTNGKIMTQNLNLTGNVVAGIYLGSIHLWNDPAIASLQSPSVAALLPNANIITVRRSDNSGTTFVTTSYLASQNSTFASQIGASANNCSPTLTTNCVHWRGSADCSTLPCQLTGSGNPGVAGQILSHINSFGYVELNYAIINSFTYAKILNHDNTTYVKPSIASTTAAVENYTSSHTLPSGLANWAGVSMLNQAGPNTYPISSFTYFLVYQELNILPSMNLNETGQAQALIAFLKYYVTTGQTFAEIPSLSFVSLPPSVVSADLASINSITYTIVSKPVHKTFSLSASSVTHSWSLSTISGIFSGDTVTLLLTSADGAPHQWYLDFNNNGVLDSNENNTSTPGGLIMRVSPVFSSTTTATNFTFIPIIYNASSIPSYGTWTFRDANDALMTGSFSISPQQIAIPFVPPANSVGSSLFPAIDNSHLVTQGSMIDDLRTNTVSGSITELTVVGGATTATKQYTITGVHLKPFQSNLQFLFVLNAAASPYTASSDITVSVSGLKGTTSYFATRTLDIRSQGSVNIVDVADAAIHFGASMGQPLYNPVDDVLASGTIDIVNITQLAIFFDAPAFS